MERAAQKMLPVGESEEKNGEKQAKVVNPPNDRQANRAASMATNKGSYKIKVWLRALTCEQQAVVKKIKQNNVMWLKNTTGHTVAFVERR